MSEYDRNVFVNCPYDKAYLKLLRPLLFAIIYLGFKPRIASERADAGELRLKKICELIGQSRYSIHDVSRLKPKPGELSRLNMAFDIKRMPVREYVDTVDRWVDENRPPG